jgi:hypothetical protein
MNHLMENNIHNEVHISAFLARYPIKIQIVRFIGLCHNNPFPPAEFILTEEPGLPIQYAPSPHKTEEHVGY